MHPSSVMPNVYVLLASTCLIGAPVVDYQWILGYCLPSGAARRHLYCLSLRTGRLSVDGLVVMLVDAGTSLQLNAPIQVDMQKLAAAGYQSVDSGYTNRFGLHAQALMLFDTAHIKEYVYLGAGVVTVPPWSIAYRNAQVKRQMMLAVTQLLGVVRAQPRAPSRSLDAENELRRRVGSAGDLWSGPLARFPRKWRSCARRSRRSWSRSTSKRKMGSKSKTSRQHSSEHEGVSWCKARGKWLATIVVAGKRRYLGGFADESAAARQREEATRARDAGQPLPRVRRAKYGTKEGPKSTKRGLTLSGKVDTRFLKGDARSAKQKAKRYIRAARARERKQALTARARAFERKQASQHKGVSWDKQKGKWHARIVIAGKRRTLGRFDSESAAARQYEEAARARDARIPQRSK
jgi:hypothetical protein